MLVAKPLLAALLLILPLAAAAQDIQKEEVSYELRIEALRALDLEGDDVLSPRVASSLAGLVVQNALVKSALSVEPEEEVEVEPVPVEEPATLDVGIARIVDLGRDAEVAAKLAAEQEKAEENSKLRELRARERRTAERVVEMTRVRGESLARLKDARDALEVELEDLAAKVREASFGGETDIPAERLRNALEKIFETESWIFKHSRDLRRSLEESRERFDLIQNEIDAFDAAAKSGRERERAVLGEERNFRELRIELFEAEISETRQFHEYLEDHRVMFEGQLRALVHAQPRQLSSVAGLTDEAIHFAQSAFNNRLDRFEHLTRNYDEMGSSYIEELRSVEFWTWFLGLFARVLPFMFFLLFGRLLPSMVERLFDSLLATSWGRRNQQKLARIAEILVALSRPTVQYGVTWLVVGFVAVRYPGVAFLESLVAIYFLYRGVREVAEVVRPTHDRLRLADDDEKAIVGRLRAATLGYQRMSHTLSEKLVRTVRRVGLVGLVSMSVHVLVDASVGFTLLGRLSFRIAAALIAFVVFYELARWRVEIGRIFGEIAPKQLGWAVSLIQNHVGRWYGVLPASFAAAYLLFWKTFSLIRPFVLGRAWFRDVSGFLFRTRLEREMRARHENLLRAPDDYLRRFDARAVTERVTLKTDSNVDALYTNWRAEKFGGAVIVGRHGSGKSTELGRIAEQIELEGELSVEVLHFRVRLNSEDELASCICEHLELPVQTLTELIESLKSMEPRAILLDDGQRTFSRRVGGYDAFDALARLIHATSRTHFWCLTFDAHAWNFVNYVRRREHRFRRKAVLKGFEVEELHQLIRSRHEPSGLELHSMREVGETILIDENTEESPFRSVVRYIHEVTGGVPASALELWKRSVSMNSANELIVRLDDVPTVPNNLKDDEWFVLSALVQHATLTFEELIDVENIEEGELGVIVGRFIDEGYIENRGEAYQVARAYLPGVVRRLIASNFLYE